MNPHVNRRRVAHLIMSPESFPKLIHTPPDTSPQVGDQIADLKVLHICIPAIPSPVGKGIVEDSPLSKVVLLPYFILSGGRPYVYLLLYSIHIIPSLLYPFQLLSISSTSCAYERVPIHVQDRPRAWDSSTISGSSLTIHILSALYRGTYKHYVKLNANKSATSKRI